MKMTGEKLEDRVGKIRNLESFYERERKLKTSNASVFCVVAHCRILFPMLITDKAGLLVWGKD